MTTAHTSRPSAADRPPEPLATTHSPDLPSMLATSGLPDAPASAQYALPSAAVYEVPEFIGPMLFNVGALLAAVSDDQARRMSFPMDSPLRLDWDFVPKPDRSGVPLWELDKHQRTLVHCLLASSLSVQGYTQALQIMAMENILRGLDAAWAGIAAGDLRHPDGYFISVFGRPALEDTWGWRFLGHHLSLSYTVVGQRYVSVTPCNMGAQPITAGTLSPLRLDDSMGFEMLHSLSEDERSVAVIHDRAPADFVTRQVPRVGAVEYPDYYDLGILDYRLTEDDREALKFVRDEPSGISAADLGADQQARLLALVDCFLDRFPAPVADQHRRRLERRGLDELFFAWAGGDRPGTPHYYRVHGHDLLIEFDNAIGGGNHIHSNWRDLDNDLGHGLLLDHYERERTSGHHLASRLVSSVAADPEPDGGR